MHYTLAVDCSLAGSRSFSLKFLWLVLRLFRNVGAIVVPWGGSCARRGACPVLFAGAFRIRDRTASSVLI